MPVPDEYEYSGSKNIRPFRSVLKNKMEISLKTAPTILIKISEHMEITALNGTA
jgi:hypothetical protein